MDNVPSDEKDELVSTHVVEVDGCYGAVSWQVPSKIYSIMARKDRDEVLDLTGERKIAPFFTTAADRLLDQVGCEIASSSLNRDVSLEMIECGCECIGRVFWSISQGLWDNLPEDQRKNLLELVQAGISAYFHTDIIFPIYSYARGRLMP